VVETRPTIRVIDRFGRALERSGPSYRADWGVVERIPGGEPEHEPAAPTGGRDGGFRSWLDWMFRNRRTGRITVAQFPNVPLWIFIGATVLRRLLPTGSPLDTAAGWVAVAGLAWWAGDEVVRGVNPWRRLLGLAGVLLAMADVVSLVH
jgi:hypothetical protein